MGPDATAVLISAGVTAGVGAAGSAALLAAGARRSATIALGAPLVMVLSLAAGVAAATRSMVVAEDAAEPALVTTACGAS